MILFPKSSLPLVFPIIEVAEAKILGLFLDFSFPYPKYIIYQQSSRFQIHLKSVYFSFSLHTSTTHHYLFRILQEPPKWCLCFLSCFLKYQAILQTVFRMIFKNFPVYLHLVCFVNNLLLENLKIKRTKYLPYFANAVNHVTDKGGFFFIEEFQLINKEGIIEL